MQMDVDFMLDPEQPNRIPVMAVGNGLGLGILKKSDGDQNSLDYGRDSQE